VWEQLSVEHYVVAGADAEVMDERVNANDQGVVVAEGGCMAYRISSEMNR
jgi:hypothetical protein